VAPYKPTYIDIRERVPRTKVVGYTMDVVLSILGFLHKFNGSNYGSIVTIILTSYAFSKQNGKDELSDPTSFFKKVYVSETTPTNGVYKINDLLRSSQGILP
jgi:hypothetical protein